MLRRLKKSRKSRNRLKLWTKACSRARSRLDKMPMTRHHVETGIERQSLTSFRLRCR